MRLHSASTFLRRKSCCAKEQQKDVQENRAAAEMGFKGSPRHAKISPWTCKYQVRGKLEALFCGKSAALIYPISMRDVKCWKRRRKLISGVRRRTMTRKLHAFRYSMWKIASLSVPGLVQLGRRFRDAGGDPADWHFNIPTPAAYMAKGTGTAA